MQPTIYHNPKCGTSRNTLAMLEQAGTEPQIIEYLKNPPSRQTLEKLIKDSGLSVREVLRDKDKLYNELDLANEKWTDEQLLDFMQEHPILMNRPIVTTEKGTRLCRPCKVLLDILSEEQASTFATEDE
ncbi:Arsenate reductase [Pseudovibrio axinellae]|uniref:Arsenate reductase n=1 Tax=Pseudovibrio axinellae TaxID=989403 RepID=A0A166ATU7_9HYPH|nr:arsenate reductase (glutaredoxin) [Pseudovibrio axinellae]KZL21542.1 Arsenate reductase [Pseudovibrio axinellae]SER08935.1 arsenate reductase [Pseudovibrio axinellae]